MGAVGSLSKSVTQICWWIAVISTFGFGTLFLVSWLSEEFATSEKWKKHRRLLITLAIIGVAGEQIGTIAEFVFSEHLQTIGEVEIMSLRKQVEPRQITTANRAILLPCLEKAPKGVIFVVPKVFDEDAERYANQIRELLKDAGFDSRPEPSNKPRPFSFGVFGTFISVQDFSHPPSQAAPVQSCFKLGKIDLPGYGNAPEWVGANEVLIGVGPR